MNKSVYIPNSLTSFNNRVQAILICHTGDLGAFNKTKEKLNEDKTIFQKVIKTWGLI